MSLDLFLSHYFFLILMLLSTWKKRIGLLCADFFIIENNIGNTVFNFTLTFSLGANNLSHNVTLSINKRVKEILTRSWYWRGGGEFASAVCVLGHQVVFQTGRAAMIAQFTTTKHTDHFGLVNGTIWQLFKSKLSIQNLIGIHFGVSRSSSTQNVTLTYYLAGSQAQTSVCACLLFCFRSS